MSFLTNFFVIGSYVIVAIALSMGLQAFGGVEPVVGWLAAAVFFLFAGQIHGTLNRAQETETLAREIETLRKALFNAEAEIETMGERLAQIEPRLEGAADRRNRRLTSELNVLEKLVQQFAGNIAERAAHDLDIGDGEQLNPKWNIAKFDKSHPSAFDHANDSQLITAVRESLAGNRVDLFLQPIVSLPQRRLRFYEALTRLRADSGEVLMPRHFLRVAEGTGLVSTIDNLLLFRSVQIVRKLMDAGGNQKIFCNISTCSLQDKAFFGEFLDFMELNTDLTGRLFFEFSQDTLEVCGPLELANLRRLTALGFRFSMDQVSHLDLDANGLRDRGFAFVKVPSHILTADDAPDIAAIKDRLARAGIDLIAEKIEDDDAATRVVQAGVDFGQGYLLGEPRPAATEPLALKQDGAAA